MLRKHITPGKLPYHVSQVHKLQERFVSDTVIARYLGQRLSDSDINALARYLYLKFGYDDVPQTFYASSLDSFRRKTVTEPELFRRLRRIVAILSLYRASPGMTLQPVTDWQEQSHEEWIPVLVRDVTPAPGAGKLGPWLLSCLVLGGTAAEVTFDYKVSQRMTYKIALLSGFSQTTEQYQFVDTRQFMALELLLLLKKGSTPTSIKIGDMGSNPTLEAGNRKIIKARYPAYRKCEFGIPVGCHQCPVGLDQCNLATRRETIQKETR
jgi:hypothetical protein